MAETLLDRFLRYVQIDTQSDLNSHTYPSTAKQWVLLRLLAEELAALGAADVTLTPHGYVLATIPATLTAGHIPTVAFLAHVDTAPDFTGTGVKPLVHRNYQGQVITLPGDPSRVLDPEQYPELKTAIGKDIVTTDGTTLLGADDKAGVAAIMTFAAHLLAHPEIPHGKIRLCFTPDEEVGRGVDKLDLDELGAHVAYTLDGENPGEVVWETFSGDTATVSIQGVSTHPGEARKRRMVNAVHLAGKLLAALPREFTSPETSDQRMPYIHPAGIEGNPAAVTVRFILRAFDMDDLTDMGNRLQGLCAGLQASEPRAKITCQITRSYRNMGYWLREDMTPVNLAYEAARKLGLTPTSPPIRGGTDGSRLTERGLPTPNLFCGGHNAHGPLEWAAVQDMELAAQMCVELAQLWAEKGSSYTGGYQPR